VSAAVALKSVRAVGIRVRVEGNDLILEAPGSSCVTRPTSWHGCVGLKTAGRLRIGRSSSTSALPSQSLTADCLGPKPKHAPSPAAWRNGSTATQRRPCRAGAWLAAAGNNISIRCCHSGQTQPVMLGCIALAGRDGIRRERPRQSRPLRRWAFETRTWNYPMNSR
jgi:hypothetical protein